MSNQAQALGKAAIPFIHLYLICLAKTGPVIRSLVSGSKSLYVWHPATQWPEVNEFGDLPEGIYAAPLEEVLQRFGGGTAQLRQVARRLRLIFELAHSTGRVARFIVFGSFVTNKAEPNDVDIFLIMQDSFDVSGVAAQAKLVFDHTAAQNSFGASVFWIRSAAAIGGEEAAVSHWQIKRDGSKRGIVEVV